jgi:diaminopimelate decarboxylase
MKLTNQVYQFSGGLEVLPLVEKYACPLYVYEAEIIKKKYKAFASAFKVPTLKIMYACKALSNINILRYLRSLGAGLDTVSIQEVQLGLQAGYSPSSIIFTPNCVSIEEIVEAADLGVKINIDNISILEHFGELRPNYPVCLRINPHIMAGGNSKISTGHIDSKFGISFHQLPHALRVVDALKIKVEGLHMHTGSEILDTEVFLNGAEILFQSAFDFKDLEYLDFGSGFKVAYDVGGMETDIEDVGRQLSERFNAFCKTYGRNLALYFEPGKYLVSEAGTFFVKVNVVKQTTSTVFAGVDSGFNHLIRPMFYDAYHKILNVSRPVGRNRVYTVVGYICETDTFGINRRICEIQEGDILAFKNAGAYCFAMASNYNSRFRPAEVFIMNGKDHLIRERETIKDLLRNQLKIEGL